MNLINHLDDFINETRDAREIKRALAVKMILQGKSSQEIEKLLQVSQSFISKWKNLVLFQGLNSLKLKYKGRKSYLSSQEQEEIINWLKFQDYVRLQDLQLYIENQYQVIFESLQSYYLLFKQAKISWKKTQKKNPAKNDKLVADKKKEIEKKLKKWKIEIAQEKLTVFMIDECHLLWGDVNGYVWGRTDTRVKVPVKNYKDRQTYYGALDYLTKEFIRKKHSSGNSKNTIDFIEYLLKQRPGQKLAIFWDGASYHRSQEIKDYLNKINQNLPEDEWLVTCILFAPNAPEQNPVEDIWLQTKNFVREFYHICKSFKIVKWLFEFFAAGQIFDFPKIYEYEVSPHSI